MEPLSKMGFRALENSYVYVDIGQPLKGLLGAFEGAQEGTGILAYVYLDHLQGMQLEVLCCASFDQASRALKLFAVQEEVQMTLPYGLLAANLGFVLPTQAVPVARFEGKLAKVQLEQDEAILKGRGLQTIDCCRAVENPDIVQVHLARGEEYVVCPVLLNGIGELQLYGELLVEPELELPVHKGDRIDFFMVKNEQGIMCLAPFAKEG